MAGTMDTGPVVMNGALAHLFAGYGIESAHRGGWLTLPGDHDMRAVVSLTSEDGRVVQLDVQLKAWPGCLLNESCEGAGASYEDAVQQAVASFATSSLPVLLSTFFGRAEHEVTREEGVIGGRSRLVTFGNAAILQFGSEGQPIEAKWFASFERIIKAASLSEGTHWIQVHYAQERRKALCCELLLDNETWDPAQAEVSRIEWPTAEGFLSIRMFLLIQGGISVSEAIGAFAEQPNESDEAIFDTLLKRGVDPIRAASLITFVPLAFGRVILREHGVKENDKARVFDETGAVQREISLSAAPVFVEASRLASGSRLTREQFESIARRSPEFAAVERALQEGASPQEIICEPPMLLLPDAREDIAKKRWWNLRRRA